MKIELSVFKFLDVANYLFELVQNGKYSYIEYDENRITATQPVDLSLASGRARAHTNT